MAKKLKAHAKAGADKEYKVLCIEDNPVNLRLITQILEYYNEIHLIAVHEPVLGLELAETQQPDLILMDINLPVMTGYEALEKLQANEKTSHIPVIAISANALANDIKRGKAAGFLEYITKPINVQDFMLKIEHTLKINT